MEKQEAKNHRKHLVSYWLYEDEEALLRKFTPSYGSRSQLARDSLLEKLNRLNRREELKAARTQQKDS